MNPTDLLTDELTWEIDDGRHHCLEATALERSEIYGDLFARLGQVQD